MNKKNKIVDFQKYLSTTDRRKYVKPTIVTFLGFSGHKNCMSSIANSVRSNGFQHIEASPKHPQDYNFFRNFFAKIDAYNMKDSSMHIGLGSVRSQAIAAEKRLSKKISSQIPIVLCGHSQGGLIAIEFWRKFGKNYNIKGIVTITSPLQGASIFKSLASYKILKHASDQSEKNKKTSKIVALTIPFFLFPIFKFLSYVFCPSIHDLLLSKKLKERRERIYRALKGARMPFLNIVATCPAPPSFRNLTFGSIGTKEIIGGGIGSKSDNVLGLTDQLMPIKWDEMEEIQVEADHGLYHIAGYDKVFLHPRTIDSISKFCNKWLKI